MNELSVYNKKIPLVSILCATFNHEKYISQTIDGFLMQKTNFQFEIIICEDKSTDSTAQIIREYEKKYPELFVTFYHKENLYSKGIDFFQTEAFPIAKGKYIAYCEGDDYWIDPLKLQKQVDFLETHADYGLVFTDADILYNNSGKIIHSFDHTRKKRIPKGDVFRKLIYYNPYKTCTALYKMSVIDNYFNFIKDEQYMMGDLGLWLYISKSYKVGYLNESTAVYRVLPNSASHFRTYRDFISFTNSGNQLKNHFAAKFNFKISPIKAFLWNLRVCAAFIIRNKKFKSFFEYQIRNIFLQKK